MTINNIIIHKKYLLCSSLFILLSSIICLIKKDFYKCAYYILLFLSTINYWINPIEGIRRNIDLTIVFLGPLFTISQFFLLKNELYIYISSCMILCCIFFFICEFIFIYFNSNKWVICHMCIHLYSSLLVIFILVD